MGFLGIIEQVGFKYYMELDISNFIGKSVACTGILISRYEIKLEN